MVQERIWIILVRLRDSENHCTGKIPGKPTKIRPFRNFFQGKGKVGNFVKKGFTFLQICGTIAGNRVGNLACSAAIMGSCLVDEGLAPAMRLPHPLAIMDSSPLGKAMLGWVSVFAAPGC